MRFIDFANANGLLIKDLHPSEKIKRCATVAHPKKLNGAYFWDGERGWVFDWAGDAQTRWYYTDKPWTEAEKQAWKKKQQCNYEAQDRKYEWAAKKAQAIINAAQKMPHGYLHRKGFIEETGLVDAEGALIIPMRNVRTNSIQGLQKIQWIEMEWQKKMMPGMRAKNAVHRIGSKNASETILCEGYATGLSIHKAARQFGFDMAVVVCFSANNMVAVADQIQGRKFIYADNDVSGTGERVAKETGLPYCMSSVVGNDANDDHMQFGLMYVIQKLMDVRLSEPLKI